MRIIPYFRLGSRFLAQARGGVMSLQASEWFQLQYLLGMILFEGMGFIDIRTVTNNMLVETSWHSRYGQ